MIKYITYIIAGDQFTYAMFYNHLFTCIMLFQIALEIKFEKKIKIIWENSLKITKITENLKKFVH